MNNNKNQKINVYEVIEKIRNNKPTGLDENIEELISDCFKYDLTYLLRTSGTCGTTIKNNKGAKMNREKETKELYKKLIEDYQLDTFENEIILRIELTDDDSSTYNNVTFSDETIESIIAICLNTFEKIKSFCFLGKLPYYIKEAIRSDLSLYNWTFEDYVDSEFSDNHNNRYIINQYIKQLFKLFNYIKTTKSDLDFIVERVRMQLAMVIFRYKQGYYKNDNEAKYELIKNALVSLEHLPDQKDKTERWLDYKEARRIAKDNYINSIEKPMVLNEEESLEALDNVHQDDSYDDLKGQLRAVLRRPIMYLGENATAKDLMNYLQGLCHGYFLHPSFRNKEIVIEPKIYEAYEEYLNENNPLDYMINKLQNELENII